MQALAVRDCREPAATRGTGAVLVCDEGDNPSGSTVTDELASFGWTCTSHADSLQAQWAANVRNFDAIVIVARTAGWAPATLRLIRSVTSTPALVIASTTIENHSALLLAGADMVSPGRPEHGWIHAATTALVRRSDPEAKACLRFLDADGLRIDLQARTITLDGEPLALSPIELNLLVYLMIHWGTVIRHDIIVQAVWGRKYGGQRNPLRIQINRLRAKLSDATDNPRFIQSHRGVGYSFVAAVREGAGSGSPSKRGDLLPTALVLSVSTLYGRLQDAPDVRLAASILAEGVVELGLCQAASVFSRENKRSGLLRLVAQTGMPSHWLHAVDEGIPINPSYVSGDTILTGEVRNYVNISRKVGRYGATRKLLKPADLAAILSVPLLHDRQAWGQVGYVRRSDDAFAPSHTLLLELLAQVLGSKVQQGDTCRFHAQREETPGTSNARQSSGRSAVSTRSGASSRPYSALPSP